MVKTAMIGFGGIAQSHLKAHQSLEAAGLEKLVAVIDVTPEQFTKRIKINIDTGERSLAGDFHVYYDLEEMLSKEEIDLIDICIPSYLHAETAVTMLERGYNVLSEKPMALNSADCEKMIAAMKKSGKRLMIGQCLRFYPEYQFIKDCIEDGRYGKVTSAEFRRISGTPLWSWQNWYHDYDKAGGVITDMQIHDLDMARYLFGEPAYVECHANSKKVKFDVSHVVMGYDFPVTSIGDWTFQGGKFAASYRIGFENATVVYEGGKVTVYPADLFNVSEPFEPELKGRGGIYNEIAAMINFIETGAENTKNPPESAAATIRLIEAVRVSAEAGSIRVAFKG